MSLQLFKNDFLTYLLGNLLNLGKV